MGNAFDRYEYERKPVCVVCGYVIHSLGCVAWHEQHPRARDPYDPEYENESQLETP